MPQKNWLKFNINLNLQKNNTGRLSKDIQPTESKLFEFALSYFNPKHKVQNS